MQIACTQSRLGRHYVIDYNSYLTVHSLVPRLFISLGMRLDHLRTVAVERSSWKSECSAFPQSVNMLTYRPYIHLLCLHHDYQALLCFTVLGNYGSIQMYGNVLAVI